jgi:hypothetical protein
MPRRGTWVEHLLAFGVAVLIGRAMYFLYWYGYLPQPFFYEPSDLYMDWFNTAYWSHGKGAYDSWGTIYPPLTFVVMRMISNPKCYADSDGLETRDCDWIGFVIIHAIFLLNIVLIAWSFYKIDRRTALPRSFALAAGMPMLYALERGNILLLCFTMALLGFGPLLKSTWLRWLCVGAAVNFKVYLIATVVTQLLKRRWLWVEGALLSTILIYLLTYGLLGVGTPAEIYGNITYYSGGFIAAQVLDIWYSSTYMPLIALLQGQNFPSLSFVGSTLVDLGLFLLPLLMLLGKGSIVVAAIATWVRPEVVPTYRLAFFGAILALISSEASGYTMIFVTLFVFMEPWRGIGRKIAIVSCYILCLPGDISIGYIPPLFRESYLAGHQVEVNIGVGLGFFTRPGIMILIAVSMSCVTIRDVWADIRTQGWSGRWRFRRDLPLLPGVLRPKQVAASIMQEPE